MDTMKDTKMQPAKDAVIEELSSAARRKEMTKDELQKAVDDVIADCIRNDYAFGSYAYKVAEAIWPLLEAAEKSDAESIAMYRRARDERDALRALVVMRFDLDHPPQFVQGHDPHDLLEPVTAEQCRWFVAEIERLRAKIAEMEKQEPVAEWIENRFHQYPQLVWNEKYRVDIGDKLYALPGAKGE